MAFEKRSLLEQLFQEYRYFMFKVAFEILHDNGLAEDAVQAAFLNLTKKVYKIDDVFSKKTKGFMRVVVKNTAIDMLRRRMKDEDLSVENGMLQLSDEKPLPLEVTISNEEIDKLQILLATLDPKYADVVLLKYYNSFSNAEIAKLLGLSKETLWTRLHRAKKMLAEKMIEGDPQREKTQIKK
jgi:RNA polymerase sigma-70 factor, ECF subfamily